MPISIPYMRKNPQKKRPYTTLQRKPDKTIARFQTDACGLVFESPSALTIRHTVYIEQQAKRQRENKHMHALSSHIAIIGHRVQRPTRSSDRSFHSSKSIYTL